MPRWILFAVAFLAAAVAAVVVLLRGSLPVLDGSLALPGLARPVSVERDALGVPTVRGSSRMDVARATGFLHAQDRFFQMDLQRRDAPGELAALVGAKALPRDRQRRVHRLRAVAREVVVAGSNGRVAWGFTNSYGDWSDRVILETLPDDASSYRTPEGVRRLERVTETIVVRGSEPVRLELRISVWGPVVGADTEGRPWALRWLAHLPEATDLGLLRMEHAATLEEAPDAGRRAGIPGTSGCRGCRRVCGARRSASPSPRAGRTRATSTCPAARAAIPCRPSTGRGTRRG